MARLSEEAAPVVRDAWAPLSNLWRLGIPAMPSWARATALAGLAAISVGAGTFMFNFNTSRTAEPGVTRTPVRLVRDDRARMRESYQLLQALGRDDGYILAADVVYEKP